MSRLAALGAAALVSIGSVAVGATASAGSPAFPPQRPTKVLVLGDSVIKAADGLLGGALPGRDITLDAEVSRSTGGTASAAAGHGTDWDVVVILEGFNDGASAGAYQPPYRQMLDQFAAVPRVVVLTLHEVRPYYAGVNRFLRDEAASRSNVTVADWAAVVAANPGCLAGDGLHLNGTGAGLLVRLVGDQVAEAETRHGWQELAAAKARFDATSTTTTIPPTTTTTAPPTTTTTEAVVLAPPVSIDRSTTTVDPGPPGDDVKDPPSDDGSLPEGLVYALPAGVVVGAASIVRTRRRRAG